MPRVLLVRLEAPLVAFGGEAVDALGVVTDFPARSMLTGLLANALGWHRHEREKLARLQERIVFAARIDREGQRLTDFQTAAIGGTDRGWTTRGRPEGRAGGAGTYLGPHIRRRDYHSDAAVTVALTLRPAGEEPDLDALAAALDEPARPLFIGRKPCLPAWPLRQGLAEAASLTAALLGAGLERDPTGPDIRLLLPVEEEAGPADRVDFVTDERDWRSGVHGGARRLRFRSLPRAAFPEAPPCP